MSTNCRASLWVTCFGLVPAEGRAATDGGHNDPFSSFGMISEMPKARAAEVNKTSDHRTVSFRSARRRADLVLFLEAEARAHASNAT